MKPSYFQQCVKIGHDYAIKPVVQKKERVWKPKQVTVVATEINEKEQFDATEQDKEWTEVPTGKGDKGKRPMGQIVL